MEQIFERGEIIRGTTRISTLRYPPFDPMAYLHVLTPEELERFKGFKHIKRQREFIATRALRHELYGNEHIHYTPEGAPFIEKDGFISISHSKNLVAIAENHEYPIGLDLEAVRLNIHMVMHKFLSAHELNHFDCSDPLTVTSIWSAKETLYKLAGRKEILFSEQLHVVKESNQWKGRINNPGHDLLVNLDIFEQEGIIFTLNASKVEYVARDTE